MEESAATATLTLASSTSIPATFLTSVSLSTLAPGLTLPRNTSRGCWSPPDSSSAASARSEAAAGFAKPRTCKKMAGKKLEPELSHFGQKFELIGQVLGPNFLS